MFNFLTELDRQLAYAENALIMAFYSELDWQKEAYLYSYELALNSAVESIFI